MFLLDLLLVVEVQIVNIQYCVRSVTSSWNNKSKIWLGLFLCISPVGTRWPEFSDHV